MRKPALYQGLLGFNPAHFQADTGLVCVRRYDAFEYQFGLNFTVSDRHGVEFADGLTLFDWSVENGLEAFSYVDWHFPTHYSAVGRVNLNILQDRQALLAWARVNPYWHRTLLASAIDYYDWYLYGNKGSGREVIRRDQFDRVAADLSNPDYIDWLLNLYSLVLGDRKINFRPDEANLHLFAYYRPYAAEKQDFDLNQGAFALYDGLRSLGHRVFPNGAWEPVDLDAASKTYPALEHVDGVMFELPFGLARWSDGSWWSGSDAALINIGFDWLMHGKKVLLTAALNRPENAPLEIYAKHYYDLAVQAGFSYFWTGNDLDGWSSGLRCWWQDFYPEKIVDSGASFEDALIEAANLQQLISLNPTAALQKQILMDGFLPVSNEFNFNYAGVDYVAQKADPGILFNGELLNPRVYFVKQGDWQNVKFLDIPRSEV